MGPVFFLNLGANHFQKMVQLDDDESNVVDMTSMYVTTTAGLDWVLGWGVGRGDFRN